MVLVSHVFVLVGLHPQRVDVQSLTLVASLGVA